MVKLFGWEANMRERIRDKRGRIELHLEKKGKSRVHSDLRFT